MKVLCVFGRHGYGDPLRGVSPEYRFFIPALQRLGHAVIFFDSLDRSKFRDYAELNQELLRVVDHERPDAMFFVPLLGEVWLETFSIVRARGVLTICWTTDDSWKYEQQSKYIASAFDAIATTYSSAYAKYLAANHRNAFLTQWAAPADALRAPIPAAECDFDVTFVGASHGNRRARVEWLASRGIQVECFGFGWPNGAVSPDRMNEVIRRSRISLNFSNSRGDNQIKARTFEVPGAGGFLMTESAAGIEKFYCVGREIETFDTMEELESKICEYLTDAPRRDAIANGGFQRTCREHTYDVRMRDLFDFATAARQREPVIALPDLTIDDAVGRYRVHFAHRVVRAILIGVATLFVGRKRARRAARRLVYELSYRLSGAKTYRAAGWPGRLFPNT